jgi:membrane associated rhomboid family serine protease
MNGGERGTEVTIAGVEVRAPAVRTIVALAAALFFIQVTVLAPSDVETALGFTSRDLGHRWWTVLTFSFVHADFLPLATNLLAIGVFGTALERLWSTGEFIRYYTLCAFGAWVAHVTFVSGDVVLAGSAGPAIGVTLAYAAHARDAQHFRVGSIAMSAGWLAAIATTGILLAGVTAAPPATAAAYLVHAGGLVAGWLYLRTASSINLVRLRNAVSPVPDEADDGPPRAIPRGQPKSQRVDDDIIARSNAAVAREAASRHTVLPPVAENREPNPLNQLLDKISAQGIESLTADERRMLDDVSRRLRDH